MVTKDKKKKQFESPEELDEFMQEEPKDTGDDLLDEFAGDEAHPAEDEPLDKTEVNVEMPELSDEEKREDMLDIAADVPVQVVAVMGKKSITMKELASMKMGEVIELSRPANEIVDLVAGGRLIAKGELVEIEGKLGVRIVKLVR